MTTIDIHTHVLSQSWLEILRTRGGTGFGVESGRGGPIVVDQDMRYQTHPAGLDLRRRIDSMDESGIDVAVLSLSAPNVHWGDAETSAMAARAINDATAEAQAAYPKRIRFLASLPLEFPDLALAELDRATGLGAVGIVTLCNLRGKDLTEPAFSPVWQEINRRRLPVFLHPTSPPGFREMNLGTLRGMAFTFDTALAFAKMIVTGFLDRYPEISFIAAHAGGVLPFIAGRLDLFELKLPATQRKIAGKPSEYLRRLYYDATTYQQDALEMVVNLAGDDHVLFGTDFPHHTDIPGILRQIDSLPRESALRIRGGNAARLFGLSA